MRETMTVHVRYKSLHTSWLSCSKQQPEMIKFCVFWRIWATTANFSYFPLKLIACITPLVSIGFHTTRRNEQFQIRLPNSKAGKIYKIHFFSSRRPWPHSCHCFSSLNPFLRDRSTSLLELLEFSYLFPATCFQGVYAGLSFINSCFIMIP